MHRPTQRSNSQSLPLLSVVAGLCAMFLVGCATTVTDTQAKERQEARRASLDASPQTGTRFVSRASTRYVRSTDPDKSDAPTPSLGNEVAKPSN
jgi:uncharacterized protein YceK